MNWHWFSRQGTQRQHNHDAASLVVAHDYVFAMIVDAAEKGSDGAGLARYWTQTIALKLSELAGLPTHDQVMEVMRSAHLSLRDHYICERAAYCAILLHTQGQQAWFISCGDCRLGIKQDAKITWLSNVHTLANFNGEEFSATHLSDPNRHTLTRCLKARSFTKPDVIQFDWPIDPSKVSSLCLCSDGYWAEHIGHGVRLELLEDDASFLELSDFSTPLHVPQANSDCDNFLFLE